LFRRLASGEHDRHERRFVRMDGEVAWAMISAAPIRGENGEFIGVFAMVADITEAKLAEERRRQSEARYRHIFESAVEGLYQSTPEGRFISINPSLAAILGFDGPEQVIEEVSDISTQLFLNADGRDVMKRQLREHGAIHDYEVQFRRRDGEIIWISINAQAVLDEDGNPVMYEGSVVDISERKRTGEALRLTQFSVDYSPIAIHWIDERGRLVYANESACKSLGYSAEEMLRLNISDIDAGGKTDDWESFWSGQDKRRIGRFETRHRRKDGTTFPVGVTSHFRRYGDAEYLFAYAYDLTERERADEALRRSQALLNEMQRVSRVGGWEVDRIDGKVQWTEGQYRLFGLPLSESPPPELKTFLETYVHPSDREEFWEKMQGSIRDKAPAEMEYRTTLPDGKEAIFVGNAIPELDEAGDVVRIYGSTRDVTMERQAARELRRSHERLLTILDGIDADIYVSGMENHEVLFMNAHMREGYGDPAGDTPCHVFFRGEPEQCSFCPKSRLLDQDGKAVETLVSEWFDPKTNRWYLNHDRAIQWLEGEMVHMHMAADITEIKAMSESLRVAMAEAEAANLAKNEFLANMSHEIRTPLNGLLGMLQLIQLSDLAKDQQECLDTAMNSGRNLLQILNDILDLSKVESGKLELEASEFELGEVLESVVSVFRHHVESRGLGISWKIDETLPRHFVADKGRLRQILFNLVGNASKFTESGRIEVEAYPLPLPGPGGMARIFFSVSDTGIGIPDNKVDAVFDPFTQVDGSSTRKYQGTGLGLGIVRRLVTLMGGNVSMTSRLGEGSVVAFTLLAEVVEQAGQEPALRRTCAEGISFSVLVAEDERVNQTVVKRLLAKLGHEALCVETGEMALQLLREKSFDCVLMDIQMPGLDGMETTRIIREELELDLPVVALTAHAMKGDRDRFLEAGMNGYVAKPFDLAELESELLRVMGLCE
jgi:PAS domain S-box-containing protein